jgi:hypothetical protein
MLAIAGQAARGPGGLNQPRISRMARIEKVEIDL